MKTKTLFSLAASSLILSACGGGGGGAPAAVTPEPVIAEKQAPFLFTANNGSNDFQLWKTEGTAETTSMVKVINASGDANINNIVRVGQLSFFVANDFINGEQLWVSDGSEAGTIALAPEPSDIVVFNDQLFFSTGDPTDLGNEELWKSDGTAAGTVKVKEINPSADSSPSEFAVLGDTLYFSANDGTNGNELWKTDGTAAGTVMAANIDGAATSSFPSNLVAFDGKLLFAANNGTDGNELWSFNGTTASLVKDINSGGSNSNPLNEFAVLGGNLYFTAYTNIHNVELWKTDGTDAGTLIVEDIRSGTASSTPRELTTVGSNVFFSATDGSTNGRELWKTDGTTTVMVKNINVASSVLIAAKSGPSAVSSDPSSFPYSLVGIDGKLYFQATKDSDTELWVSDGTESGTVLLKDINTSGSSEPLHLGFNQYTNQAVAAVENIGVLFVAESADKGRELWISNGTAEGTVIVKDINPDAGDGMPSVAK